MSRLDELIAELCPNGVEYLKLKDVAEVLNGYAFKSKQYVDKGIRVIRISDVQKGRISDKDVKYYPEASKKEIERYMLNDGDIVVSLTGDVGRVAQIQDVHLPAALNQRVACLRGHTGKVLNRYLFHLLDQVSFESDAIQAGRGSAQKNLSTVWLGNYLIPIPPIEVQEEIVRILDTFTSLTAELTAELTARRKQYEYYRDFLLTFGNNPDIKWMTLGEIGPVCMCKRIMKAETSPVGDVPFFKIGTLGKEPDAFISQEKYDEYRKAFSFPKKGDILISAAGTIGRTVIYDGKPAYFQDSNIVWIDNDESKVLNKYLYYCYAMKPWSISTGGTIARLYNDNISKAKIPVPPLEEQERIVAILDRFDALCNDLTSGIPAEIEARQKQYEYYRDKLLSFKEVTA